MLEEYNYSIKSITIRLMISVFIAVDNVLCWVDICISYLSMNSMTTL